MFAQSNLIGQVLDRKYLIEKKLGQGGMGSVFLATHLGTMRSVALKVIMPKFTNNTNFLERFKREAEVTGQLRHQNIINVTDFGFAYCGSQQIAYLVMEYLDGLTLAELLKQEGPLPLELAIDILEQICLALHKAHTEGVIHRDLKPENTWLEPDGSGSYHVKILDFGLVKFHDMEQGRAELGDNQGLSNGINDELFPRNEISGITDEHETSPIERLSTEPDLPNAKTLREELTRPGKAVGTPIYMSPEQWSNKQVDNRSDIYSIGVMAYEMLAGKPPFSGNKHALMIHHIATPPPSLKKARPDIQYALAAVILRAMAKEPDERHQSILEFATALRKSVAGRGPLFELPFGKLFKQFLAKLRFSHTHNI